MFAPDPAAALATFLTWWRRTALVDDLPSTSLSTLDTLDRLGPQRLSDLATRERITQPGMTALVRRLADDGLVEKVADPGDGRVARVQLTDAGRLRLAGLRARRVEQLDLRIRALSERDRAALAAAVPALHHLISEGSS